MKQFYIAEITTKDKLIHQGIFYKPTHPGKKAMLWVHGLTSNFYSNVPLLEAFADSCEKNGPAFAVFNTRGHDMVTSLKKKDRRKKNGYTSVSGGAGNEVFTHSVYDIDAGIDFLVKQGYEEIVLIGHSTGANKVSFYSGRKNDPRILGVILISPISDRLVPQKVSTNHNGDLLSMNRFIDQGKGDELMPGKIFFPLTPKRFVSLYSRGSEEDTFDYGDPQPKMNYFSKITKPLLVIFAEKDESSDRPMYQIKNIFDACSTSRHYESTIVKNAFHSFGERENLLIELIMTWVLKL